MVDRAQVQAFLLGYLSGQLGLVMVPLTLFTTWSQPAARDTKNTWRPTPSTHTNSLILSSYEQHSNFKHWDSLLFSAQRALHFLTFSNYLSLPFSFFSPKHCHSLSISARKRKAFSKNIQTLVSVSELKSMVKVSEQSCANRGNNTTRLLFVSQTENTVILQTYSM